MQDSNDKKIIRFPSFKSPGKSLSQSSSDSALSSNSNTYIETTISAEKDKLPTKKNKLFDSVKKMKYLFQQAPPPVPPKDNLTLNVNPAKRLRLGSELNAAAENAPPQDTVVPASSPEDSKILSTTATRQDPESIEGPFPIDEVSTTITVSASSVNPIEIKTENLQKVSEPSVKPAQPPVQTAKRGGDQPKAKLKYGPTVSPYLNPKISAAAIVMRKNKLTNDLELLLTQRWINPQKGFWELPGDFIGHQDPSKDILRILKHQTNLDGSHAETICVRGDPARDERDHNVTFFFFVILPETEHQVNSTPVLKMEQDGTIITVDTPYSKIDHRITPSWAWWYPVSQLPNWYSDQERIDLNKPLDDGYELVKVAFDHQMVFPAIKERFNEFEKHIAVIESPQQPLNRGNSALTTDIIVVRQTRDLVYEIALIERGQNPFQGKKAFPGGFVNYREDPPHGAVRELEEETFLTGSPMNTYFLGYKGSTQRDPRQHTVTCAYVLRADPKSLSKLMGGDDAASAKWYNLSDAFEWAKTKSNFAFDHSEILLDFKAWWEVTGEKDGWYVKEEIPD